jgi:hypothetical protein
MELRAAAEGWFIIQATHIGAMLSRGRSVRPLLLASAPDIARADSCCTVMAAQAYARLQFALWLYAVDLNSEVRSMACNAKTT